MDTELVNVTAQKPEATAHQTNAEPTPLAKSYKTKPEIVSEEPYSSMHWSGVIALTGVTLGLLWLLLKRRT